MPTLDSVDSQYGAPAVGNIKERIERLNLAAEEESRGANGSRGSYSERSTTHHHNGIGESGHHSSYAGNDIGGTDQVVTHTRKHSTTQQVTTVTKMYTHVQQKQVVCDGNGRSHHPSDSPVAGGNGSALLQNENGGDIYSSGQHYPRNFPPQSNYSSNYAYHDDLLSPYSGGRHPDQRTASPVAASERSASPRQQTAHQHNPAFTPSGYQELDSTLMPATGGHCPTYSSADAVLDDSPYQTQQRPGSSMQPAVYLDESTAAAFMTAGRPGSRMSRQSAGNPAVAAPRAVFDEVIRDVVREQDLSGPPPVSSHDTLQFRDPDLHEVINFLSNANNVVKANAAAYLQHLCYMDDPMKQKTRALGGIPPLVLLLSHDIPEVHRNACGALRNLSYGRQNDENKRAIHNAGGIPALIRLLRKTPENEIKELGTGILWNLSSCEDLKRIIIDDGLSVLVNYVIIPHSGWNRGSVHAAPVKDVFWSTVFRNATGVLRNVSSAGEYARRRLRECEGLVDALLLVIRSAIGKANIDNKCVENCVCVLRNLSYRCQEVDDPNYDRQTVIPQQNRGTGKQSLLSQQQQRGSTDNAGCFGGRKQRDISDTSAISAGNGSVATASGLVNGGGGGMHLLWQPDIVQPYLKLLSDCSNPETLEAAAGALQNLAACYWQPSIDIRATVRKEKGLPILVELLRMEADRVVCAVATALRNLAIDQRNKELIGKYAMRDLVQKLPGGGSDVVCSDDTIAAVLATLNEVIRKSSEFCRSLFELDGARKLLDIARQRNRYSSRVIKFAGQLLFSMWMHQDLRETYKKAGYREADFVTKSVAARNSGAAGGGAGSGGGSSVNSTLSRPMASQGGTRYEDRTMPRGGYSTADYAHFNTLHSCAQPDQVYSQQCQQQTAPGEPVYAQVNRERKRQQQLMERQLMSEGGGAANARVWGVRDSNGAAGDSWV